MTSVDGSASAVSGSAAFADGAMGCLLAEACGAALAELDELAVFPVLREQSTATAAIAATAIPLAMAAVRLGSKRRLSLQHLAVPG